MKIFKKWRISLLGIAQLCSFGTLYYSFPQMAAAIELEMGWSTTSLYSALTLSLLLSSISTAPIGKLIDKGYGRITMATGTFVIVITFILASKVTHLYQFYIVMSVLGLIQSATLYEAAFAFLALHCKREELTKCISTLTLWGGFASTVFIPIIEILLQSLDWRSVYLMLSGVNFFICLPIYYTLPNKTRNVEISNSEEKKKFNEIKKDVVFLKITLSFTIMASIAAVISFHLYPALVEVGYDIKDVVLILTLLGPAQVFGRLVLLKSKLSISIFGLLAFITISISLLGLAFYRNEFFFSAIFILLYGLANGVLTIVKGAIIPELVSQSQYGLINGLMNIPIKILGALSPAAATFLWGVNDNYGLVFFVLSILTIVMLVSYIFALRHYHGKSINKDE